MRKIDLTGKRFGRLTVIKQLDGHRQPNGAMVTQWLCKCDCGNEIVVSSGNIRSGHTISCGCYREEKRKTNSKTHGMAHTRIYNIWTTMKQRCYCKNKDHYNCYGGRGITVCKEWKDDFKAFYDWAVSNGYKDTLTIDRIDVNGNYCPENCRWITQKEQANNTRATRFITHNGITKSISEWCEELGINKNTLHSRIDLYGWSIEDAFSKSVRKVA